MSKRQCFAMDVHALLMHIQHSEYHKKHNPSVI